MPDPVGRAGLGRLAPTDGGLRAVQQRVLRSFAASGAPPSAASLDEAATPHLVQIDGGPAVFSMCAVDALGIAAMLGTPVTISSAEPGTGTLITVTVPASGVRAVWEPSGTVVFDGEPASCGPAPDTVVPSVAADACCGVINFFTSRTRARAWAAMRPEVSGRTLSQEDALAIGIQTFGHLLRTGT
jgi:hypothetical protein